MGEHEIEVSIYSAARNLNMSVTDLTREIESLSIELGKLTAQEEKTAGEIEKIRKSSFRENLISTLAGVALGAIVTYFISI